MSDSKKNNLLKKKQDFQYDNDNLFKNDKLDREGLIISLSNLIWSADQSFVLSVESSWGTGKTVFINLWKQYLKQNNTLCIYFNAWETDFASDPIIPFIGCFEKFVFEEIKDIDSSSVKMSLEKLKMLGGYFSKKSLPGIIKLVTKGIIDINDKDLKKFINNLKTLKNEFPDLLSNIDEDSVDEFTNKITSVNILKDELSEISKKIIQEKKSKPQLVCFIDELDRCRPDYAISLLERLKHVFSIDGIVFVVAIDRRQLENSIKSIYGSDIDASGYLLKFIDYRFILPNKGTVSFNLNLFEEFGIIDIIKQRRTRNKDYDRDLGEAFSIFSKIFNLSLREKERLFTELNLFLRILSERYPFIPNVIILLLMTKMKDINFYRDFLVKSLTVDEFEKKFINYSEFLLDKNELRLLGLTQGILLKYLSTDDGNQVISNIPKEYIEMNNSDGYNRNKFLGYQFDEKLGFDIEKVIFDYTGIIELLKDFKL